MNLLKNSIGIACTLVLLLPLFQTKLFAEPQSSTAEPLRSTPGLPSRPTPGLPSRSTPGLPERPTAVAIETPDKPNDEVGAFLELTVEVQEAGFWSVVQWQDGNGYWHDVEGWRAEVVPDYVIRWWVAPRDLESGPFRWIVYKGEVSERVIYQISQPFNLPSGGQVLELVL